MSTISGSTTSNQSDVDKREKVQALSLAKDCYSMKLELLTNATVVDDPMKFINNQKQNLHSDLQKQINGSTNTDTIITTDVTLQEEPIPSILTFTALTSF
ncbi:MAG: hypothetical protein WBL88_00695 [Nitrososphaeraceae archaeon]